MDRPDLISTFTKIELWRQTQFKRIVYLDADTVVLRAPNELLTHPAEFAAVPDIGWPDCFNSGLLVLNPNLGDYYSLLALAQRGISFDGADQGLLNMHFQDWTRLSFTYNCTPSGNYQYVPAYRHFQSSINVVHFIGREKPWTLGRDNKYNSGVYGELLGRWWSTYDKHYRIHVSRATITFCKLTAIADLLLLRPSSRKAKNCSESCFRRKDHFPPGLFFGRPAPATRCKAGSCNLQPTRVFDINNRTHHQRPARSCRRTRQARV